MIIVDTREQKPLWDSSYPSITFQKLDEGDYTTQDLLGKAHAERKSGNDLYGSIIQNHKRFRNEILRAKQRGLTLAIFVECSKETFFAKRFEGGFRLQAKPTTLRNIITTFQDKYGVEFVWCEDRDDMQAGILRWFANQRKLLGVKSVETSTD